MTEVKRLDLGAVSAYALAVEKGYTGTEEEFVEILTNALNYATQAQESASAAAGSAEEAGNYKTQAGEILDSVNLAGTQQIEAIESAGTQQTNAAKEAIEAKGKETLDSIPDSYEALQGDVTQLRGDLGYKSNLNTDDKTNIVNAINEVNNRFLNPVGDAVTEWLDNHPEATTTVQDHSLTIDKMVIGTLGYVTPEMFGAVGDGETDDTETIQMAIDSGAKIVFFNTGKYLVKGTLTISNNITFSGNGRDSIIFTNIDNVIIDVSGNINFIIENIQIKNESTGRTNNSVYIHGISNTIIKNVYFNNNTYGGKFDLYIKNVTTSIVEKCIFNHSSIKLNTWDCKVDKCWVWALSQNYGIYIVDSSGNITITNTDIVPPLQSNPDYVQHENIESNWDSAKLQAGIVIGRSVNNVKMSNIYIDGNPTLVTGRGIIVNEDCFNILIDDWSANMTNDDLILVISSYGVTISRGQIFDYNGANRDLIRFMKLGNQECHDNEISSNTFISSTKNSDFEKLNSAIRVDSSFSGKIVYNRSFYNNGVGTYKNPIIVETYKVSYELYTNKMMGADFNNRKTGTLPSGTKTKTINFSYYGFKYKPFIENVKLIKSTGEIIPFQQISDNNNVYISLPEALESDISYIISAKL